MNVQVAAAAGGLPMVEAHSRIVKEDLPTWKVHLVIAGDDFHVLHQKTNVCVDNICVAILALVAATVVHASHSCCRCYESGCPGVP